MIRRRTALPVTCSHELSAGLNGPRRALTAVLNARLVGMIDRLIAACEAHMGRRGISAPLMVVRGDGARIEVTMDQRSDAIRRLYLDTVFGPPGSEAK